MALYGNNPTDPKKTTKTVTKGKPTTTTSTRRGEIRPGIPGTFTDTKVDTPVTTTTNTTGGGSKEFNTAFANARKSGSPTFDFGGTSYTTDLSDSKKTNESSTTSTFKRDKVQNVSSLNPSGIKFSPQSYKTGKTQTIQRPGEDSMHVMKVYQNNAREDKPTRDYHMVQPMGDGSPGYFQGKQAITQDYRVMTLKQKENLIQNVDLHNKLLNEKYSEEAVTKQIQSRQEPTKDPRVIARRKEHLQTQIGKAKKRIEGNTAFYQTPK